MNLGDCLAILKNMSDNSIDSIVTDPPYGLSFMGKKWDYEVPSIEIWKECLRVLKPGGHLLSFGGTRTYHRLVVNIEDAGFEIRDCIQWNFGSGFPKSTSVKKSGIKQGIFCGCENTDNLSSLSESKNDLEVLGEKNKDSNLLESLQREAPRLESDKIQQQWPGQKETGQGHEVGKESSLEGRSDLQKEQRELHRPEICQVSEAILSDEQEGRLHHGTPIDSSSEDKPFIVSDRGCSSPGPQHSKQSITKFGVMADKQKSQASRTWDRCPLCSKPIFPDEGLGTALKPANEPICVARKPLEKGLTVAQNVLKWGCGAINIDASRIAGAIPVVPQPNFKSSKGVTMMGLDATDRNGEMSRAEGRWPANIILDEVTGCATWARFFYIAKASKAERNRGLEGMPTKQASGLPMRSKDGDRGGQGIDGTDTDRKTENQNFHPTVKPTKLMEYLIKLVTPPQGTVLDPFMGSGTTGVAAKQLGFKFIGCEMNPEYFEIAKKRISEDTI